MKTKITLLTLFAALTCFINRTAAQVDLLPGINYSYTPPGANGIIAIGEIDVLNNGSGTAGAFDVALYIYNSAISKAYIIWDSTLAGENGNALIALTNWSVNINKTPNIPAGTYQLGVWVNYKHMVVETDTNNNAGLLSGSWTYAPNAINEVTANIGDVRVYPNPGNGLFQLGIRNYKLGIENRIEVYNLLGERIYSSPLTTYNSPFTIDISSQPKGAYIYKVLTAEGTQIANGKLIKQ